MTDDVTYEFVLDDPVDLEQQEMEAEARDALQADEFSVFAKCRGCLTMQDVSPQHLCEACAELDTNSDGALLALIANK